MAAAGSEADADVTEGADGGKEPGDGRDAPDVGDSFEDWLRGRLPARGLRSKGTAVLDVLLTQPRRASFASTAELASLAAVNIATVTRTAQTLGFAGWPALQQELRARYLSALSAPDVAAEHHATDGVADASLRRDLDSVALLTRRLDGGAVRRVAEAVAAARHTVVVADGSYAATGIAFAHNARLAGYRVTAITGGDAQLANVISDMTDEDALVAISFWRLYASTVLAAGEAHHRGAKVFALTDAASPALTEAADEVLLVPAEGVSFFPSLTAGTAVVQAVVAELAAIDPERTRLAIEAAEAQWDRFGLLHRRPRPRNGSAEH
ncbi:MurR/RpiR family transcriptional regulator [Streptomyces sp. NPDC047737]|uniref:MurR/RpiR family transcriptional regulator n=1 Tax=unclassified Streptomyces TaxID=2593676 RepID=UPI00340AB9C6